MVATTVVTEMRSVAVRTKRTITTTTTDTDQDDPDYDPGREEDGDTAVQAMIHAIPETLQPGANQRRVQSAVQQL